MIAAACCPTSSLTTPDVTRHPPSMAFILGVPAVAEAQVRVGHIASEAVAALNVAGAVRRDKMWLAGQAACAAVQHDRSDLESGQVQPPYV